MTWKNIILRFSLLFILSNKLHLQEQYLRPCIRPYWWSPGSYAWRDKNMCITFFLVALCYLEEAFDYEIEREELSVMGMPRELDIYSGLLGF